MTSRQRKKERPAAHDLAGAGIVLVSASCYASNVILARIVYTAGGNPITLLTIRTLFFVAALALIIRLGRKPMRLDQRERYLSLALGVLIAGQSLAFYSSFRYIPVSLASLIQYTYPLLVSAGMWIVEREPLRPLTLGCLAAALAGLALALQVSAEALDPRGLALAGMGALGLATTVLVSNRILRRADSRRLTFHYSLTMAVIYLVVITAAGPVAVPAATEGRLALALVPVIYVGAVLGFFTAMTMIGPTRASLFSAAEPVFILALAAVALGERLSVIQVMGAALVIGALLAAQFGSARRAVRA